MKIIIIIQAKTMVRFYTSNNIFGTWEQRFFINGLTNFTQTA